MEEINQFMIQSMPERKVVQKLVEYNIIKVVSMLYYLTV